jgi:hypothetical protein
MVQTGSRQEERSPPALPDAIPQLIVVGEEIGKRFVAANFVEPGFRGRYGGTQGEGDSFPPVRNSDAPAKNRLKRLRLRVPQRDSVVQSHGKNS